MKKIIPVFILSILSASLTFAQTAPPPTTPQGTFFQSALGYFGSFNANLAGTFGADRFNVWAGADTVNNQNLTASLGVEFLPWHVPSTNAATFASALSFESVTRNATVAGVVVSEQAGAGFNFTYINTRVTGYLDGGYRFDTQQGYIAPGVRIKKALTDNTYAGIGLELPIYFTHAATPSPTLSIFTGFKF